MKKNFQVFSKINFLEIPSYTKDEQTKYSNRGFNNSINNKNLQNFITKPYINNLNNITINNQQIIKNQNQINNYIFHNNYPKNTIDPIFVNNNSNISNVSPLSNRNKNISQGKSIINNSPVYSKRNEINSSYYNNFNKEKQEQPYTQKNYNVSPVYSRRSEDLGKETFYKNFNYNNPELNNSRDYQGNENGNDFLSKSTVENNFNFSDESKFMNFYKKYFRKS